MMSKNFRYVNGGKIMDTIHVLEDVHVKTTGKKMSNKNRERAVGALLTLATQGSKTEQIVEFLLKLQYPVCQSFFGELASLPNCNIMEIVETLINDEQFQKSKAISIIPKGFTSFFALANNKNHQEALLILNQVLIKSEKSNSFSDMCLNNFKKFIVDEGGLPKVISIFQQVMDGLINCSECDQKRFAKFNMIINDKFVINKEDNTPTITDTPTLNDIMKYQQETLAILRKLSDNQSIVDHLTSALNQKNAESLEKDRCISVLNADLSNKDIRITEAEKQVLDLTERLRISIHMDDISSNQELITLKNNISSALKLEYEDFVKSKTSPLSQDLFEVYISMLTRIFKLLKRYGISCEEE